MATNNAKWETVVNKKKSHVTKSDVKKAQQKFIEGEKVPKVDVRGSYYPVFAYSLFSKSCPQRNRFLVSKLVKKSATCMLLSSYGENI